MSDRSSLTNEKDHRYLLNKYYAYITKDKHYAYTDVCAAAKSAVQNLNAYIYVTVSYTLGLVESKLEI